MESFTGFLFDQTQEDGTLCQIHLGGGAVQLNADLSAVVCKVQQTALAENVQTDQQTSRQTRLSGVAADPAAETVDIFGQLQMLGMGSQITPHGGEILPVGQQKGYLLPRQRLAQTVAAVDIMLLRTDVCGRLLQNAGRLV